MDPKHTRILTPKKEISSIFRDQIIKSKAGGSIFSTMLRISIALQDVWCVLKEIKEIVRLMVFLTLNIHTNDDWCQFHPAIQVRVTILSSHALYFSYSLSIQCYIETFDEIKQWKTDVKWMISHGFSQHLTSLEAKSINVWMEIELLRAAKSKGLRVGIANLLI